MESKTSETDDSVKKDGGASNEDAYAWVNQIPEISKAVGDLTDLIKKDRESFDERVTSLVKSISEKEAETKKEVDINVEDEDEDEDKDKDMKSKKTKKSDNSEINELKETISKMAASIDELKSTSVAKSEDKETDTNVVKKSVETTAPATGVPGSEQKQMTPQEYARKVVDKFPRPQLFGEAAGNMALIPRLRSRANQLEKLTNSKHFKGAI